QRTALAAARKDPALTGRNADVVADWPLAPPFAQQYQHLVGQHDVAILAALRLHDADDPLRAVDVTDPEAHHLAGPQAASVGDAEHDAGLQAWRHLDDPFHLLRCQHLRQLQRLLQVIDLGGKIMPAQRHLQQEPQSRHDAVAVGDAAAALHHALLEGADVVGGGSVGRALEERGKPLAAVDVAALRVPPEVARDHVVDHALAQRADGCRCALLRGTHSFTPEYG